MCALSSKDQVETMACNMSKSKQCQFILNQSGIAPKVSVNAKSWILDQDTVDKFQDVSEIIFKSHGLSKDEFLLNKNYYKTIDRERQNDVITDGLPILHDEFTTDTISIVPNTAKDNLEKKLIQNNPAYLQQSKKDNPNDRSGLSNQENMKRFVQVQKLKLNKLERSKKLS